MVQFVRQIQGDFPLISRPILLQGTPFEEREHTAFRDGAETPGKPGSVRNLVFAGNPLIIPSPQHQIAEIRE